MTERHSFDSAAYVQRVRGGPCFICEFVAGNPSYRHHMVYEDHDVVAFLNRFPVLYGYVLVAPREHREQATGDFSLHEYLYLQQIVYHIAEALRATVPTERVYILTLGSQQGNRHVHWHVAPLPPGVPYDEQQFEALRFERGIVSFSDEEMSALAAQIGRALRERIAASGPLPLTVSSGEGIPQ